MPCVLLRTSTRPINPRSGNLQFWQKIISIVVVISIVVARPLQVQHIKVTIALVVLLTTHNVTTCIWVQYGTVSKPVRNMRRSYNVEVGKSFYSNEKDKLFRASWSS